MNSTQLDQQEEAIRYLAERVSLMQYEMIGTPELEVLDRVVFLLDYNKPKNWEKEFEEKFELLWKNLNDSGWSFTRNGLSARKEHPKTVIKKFIKNLIK